MSTGPGADNPGSSTRPYLLRALHDWCTDNGFTPYIAVHVDASVQVPAEYVKNGEIVLNVGFEATSGLKLGNEMIEFKARFGGVPREIVVPIDHVVAIYARENGQGMAFPMPSPGEAGAAAATPSAPASGTGGAGKAGRAPSASGPAPARGLRLARQEREGREPRDAGPGGNAPEPGAGQAPAAAPQPPEPPEPGAPRPSLKRVK
ncbi:MAG: ClpXP protease specificity-enhancing factor [Rubrivivax sp.]|nr:ClpXP protease specificity-enhancing factor [Rubrivivax sp.]